MSQAIPEESLADDHLIPIGEFLKRHGASLEAGHSPEAAAFRLKQHGKNVFTQKQRQTLCGKLFRAFFRDGFSALLWTAAASCLFCAYLGPDAEFHYNLTLCAVFLFVIACQGAFTLFQILDTSKLLRSFGRMLPAGCIVLRGGRLVAVLASELVPGDVVRLEAGDRVPADIRVVSCSQARSEKSSITGESETIAVSCESTGERLAESRNILLCGSSLVEGSAIGVVYKTGNQTVLGRVASLALQTKPATSSLQREVRHFVAIIATLAALTSLIIFGVWVCRIRIAHPEFLSPSQILVVCIISSVAFVPTGVPVAVTLTLAIAARAMYRVSILVKQLDVIDTLGAATVIATDKTGTITQNQMSVSRIWVFGRPMVDLLAERIDEIRARSEISQVAFLASICNRATPSGGGSATDRALLTAAQKITDIEEARSSLLVLAEIPFSSSSKMHAMLFKRNAKLPLLPLLALQESPASFLAIAKGAPEIIQSLCSAGFYDSITETVQPFTAERSSEFSAIASSRANCGERVLAIAFAYPSGESEHSLHDCVSNKRFIFFSFVSLIDPPRPGVAEAISECHEAGVRVAMVTGDHPDTAVAVARMAGIVAADSEVKSFDGRHRPGSAIIVLGKEIGQLAQEDWDFVLGHRELVFARTTPQDKLEVVRQFQQRRHIVAVTGDGVNDAPALKKADVGIAMGVAGSDVSKEAARLVICDDNFPTIVTGIGQGRLLFENLKKVVCYLLSAGSFSEIVPMLLFVGLGIPLPLSPIQMIVVCMGTDLIGGIFLASERAESSLMHRPPRDRSRDRLVSLRTVNHAFANVGLMQLAVSLLVYFCTLSHKNVRVRDLFFAYDLWTQEGIYGGLSFGQRTDALRLAQTGYFTSLVVMQAWNLLCARTRIQSFFRQKFRATIVLTVCSQVGLAMFVSYTPWFHSVFHIESPLWFHWAFPAVLGCALFGFDEYRKAIARSFPDSIISKISW